jgi:D-3-phosphoglycerate dehydrogenase
MKKILVTPRSLTRSGHPAFDRFRQAGYEVVFCTPGKQPDEQELLELLPDCVGYLAGVEKVPAAVLEAAPQLKVISRNGSGIDNIDLKAAEKLGIRICKTEGANAKGVAELTIGLMFALARWVPFHDGRLKSREWERKKGIELEDRTLGLIGCGQIGMEVAIRATGLQMKVLAYRRNPDPAFSPSPRFSWTGLDQLLASSDMISLHRPASPDRTPVIDAAAIAKMKKGAFLINTARASLVDGKAALAALESGQLGGLAIDVYEKEPPDDYGLIGHDRVIATPHLGGFTDESVDRATFEAVDNLLNAL